MIRNNRKRQLGAVGLFGVLVFLLAILFTALGVDTGRLMLEKRQLQKVADLAALHAIQSAGLCSGVGSLDAGAVTAAAQANAATNGYDGDLVSEAGAVAIGTLVSNGSGVRQFTATAATDADTVQVTASANVTRSLMAGGWFAGTTPLHASAVAHRYPKAEFNLGSFLVGVDSDDVPVINQVLGGFLGSNVNLQLVSYQGLAAAQVSLADLAQGAAAEGVINAGTVEALLDAQVTVADMINIMLHAVDTSSAAWQALTDVLAAAGVSNGTFRIGDLIQVTAADPEAAGDAQFNVGSLLSAAVQTANSDHAITIPVSMTLPAGLGSATLKLYVVEPPKFATGRPGQQADGSWYAQTSTAQVRVEVDTTLDKELLGLVRVTGSINLWSEVARADGHLETIRCASLANEPLATQVSIGVTPGLAQLGLGGYSDFTAGGAPGSAALTVKTVTGIPLVAPAGTTIASVSLATDGVDIGNSQAQPLDFEVSYAAPTPQTQTTGTNPVDALTTATQTAAGVNMQVQAVGLGLGLVGLTDAALTQELQQTVLEPALSAFNTGLLSPLFELLGVYAGGADVQLTGLHGGTVKLVI